MKKIMIAAMIPLAFLLTSCGEKKINPNDYLTIAYDGYSEAATAVASLDVNKMVTDYPEAFRLGKDYKQSDLNKVVNQINQSALGTLSKTEGISNGDEISFSWDKNALSALEGSYKVKWSGYKDVKETAAGIPELIEYNPFDGFTPEFKGKSPHITTNGDYTFVYPEDCEDLYLAIRYLPEHGEYSTGDKLTARVYVWGAGFDDSFDVVEFGKNYGYLITQTEKEYTVE